MGVVTTAILVDAEVIGVTHQPLGLSGTAYVWLNDGQKPYRVVASSSSFIMARMVGITISGANGSEATPRVRPAQA